MLTASFRPPPPSVTHSCIFRVNSNRSAQYPILFHSPLDTAISSQAQDRTQDCTHNHARPAPNRRRPHQTRTTSIAIKYIIVIFGSNIHCIVQYTVWCGARSRAVQRPCSSLHHSLFARDSAARVNNRQKPNGERGRRKRSSSNSTSSLMQRVRPAGCRQPCLLSMNVVRAVARGGGDGPVDGGVLLHSWPAHRIHPAQLAVDLRAGNLLHVEDALERLDMEASR
jgi:hypothetical protein